MAWKEFEQESTVDLIEYMKWGNDPQLKDTADDAFIVFCFRYREDVQRKVRIVAGNWGYDSTVADCIAEKTFERFRKYLSFKPGECGRKTIDICVQLYLLKISGRLLADYRKAILHPNPFIGDEEIIHDFPDLDVLPASVERKAIMQKKYDIIKGALDRLSPKHNIIYLTYKQYEQQLNEGFNLPRALQQSLRDELGLSQASIRVYKKEAFDTVDQYLKLYGAK